MNQVLDVKELKLIVDKGNQENPSDESLALQKAQDKLDSYLENGPDLDTVADAVNTAAEAFDIPATGTKPSIDAIARIQELGTLIPADLRIPAETLQMLRTHITRVGIANLQDYSTEEQCIDGINALTESGNMSACGIGDLANRFMEIGGLVNGKPKYTWKQLAEMCGGKLADTTMAQYAKATANIPLEMRPTLPFGIGHLRVVSDMVRFPADKNERAGIDRYLVVNPILDRCKKYIAGEVYAIHYFKMNSAGAKVTAKPTDEPKTTEQVPFALPTVANLAKYSKALWEVMKKVDSTKTLRDIPNILPIAFTMTDRRMVQAISKGVAESCLPVDPSLQDLKPNQVKVLKNVINEVCGITIGPDSNDRPKDDSTTAGLPNLTPEQEQELKVKAAEVESARLAALEETVRLESHMNGNHLAIDEINTKSIQGLVTGLASVVFLNSVVAAVMLLVNSKKDADGKYSKQNAADCLNRIRKAENDAREVAKADLAASK